MVVDGDDVCGVVVEDYCVDVVCCVLSDRCDCVFKLYCFFDVFVDVCGVLEC